MWFYETDLVHYNVVESEFKLLQLPLPALAHVVSYLPIGQGAQVVVVVIDHLLKKCAKVFVSCRHYVEF
jgi:hypothetical protein